MAKIIFQGWPGGVTRVFDIPDAQLPEIEIDYGDSSLPTLPERSNLVISNIMRSATQPLRWRRDVANKEALPEPDITDVIAEET